MTWDPDQYLQFDDLRIRPALDLVGRIPEIDPTEIWDLGCGTGDITHLLARRWPQASVYGLDSSNEMLDRAHQHENIDWVLGDIAGWEPEQPVGLIFSNAALHWIGDHASLFRRLFGFVGAGGVLAVQMPRNHNAPSHQVLFNLARSDRWRDRVGGLVVEDPVSAPSTYYELLATEARSVEIWETTYQQELRGDDAVTEWTKGSTLRPYLAALGGEADAFFDEYSAALRPHYPRRTDGTTQYPFRRLFMVARH